MHGLEQLDEDDGGTVFRDVIMLALAGFVAISQSLLDLLVDRSEFFEKVGLKDAALRLERHDDRCRPRRDYPHIWM